MDDPWNFACRNSSSRASRVSGNPRRWGGAYEDYTSSSYSKHYWPPECTGRKLGRAPPKKKAKAADQMPINRHATFTIKQWKNLDPSTYNIVPAETRAHNISKPKILNQESLAMKRKCMDNDMLLHAQRREAILEETRAKCRAQNRCTREALEAHRIRMKLKEEQLRRKLHLDHQEEDNRKWIHPKLNGANRSRSSVRPHWR